jgi:hypothetical protein
VKRDGRRDHATRDFPLAPRGANGQLFFLCARFAPGMSAIESAQHNSIDKGDSRSERIMRRLLSRRTKVALNC